MKIGIAQIAPKKGDISANIEAHLKFIEQGLTMGVEAIFFPELSLTGYEPALSKELAMLPSDVRLNVFQELSDENSVIIGLGVPTVGDEKSKISMVIFEPGKSRQLYSKQALHEDEWPYFERGTSQVIIETKGIKIAPAICYESMQRSHAEHAFTRGTDVYLTSVAKSATDVQKAFDHYPIIAREYSMVVFMVNSVGHCDNFLSVGFSSVWTKEGSLAGQLDDRTEGVMVFDTETGEVEERIVINND